jgi:polysaccharide biosynthesis protein PslG
MPYRNPSAAARLLAGFALAVVLAVVLAFGGSAPLAAQPAGEAPPFGINPFGVNVHAPAGEELARVLDRAAEAGLGWVRIDFVWAFVEPARDVYDWRIYDEIAAAARARGIEVYATLAYTPAWATSGPELSGVPEAAEWRDFCRRAATRYRGKIRHWGVWNEPNLDRFWSGSRREYLDVVLLPCADAIHAADPQARVGGPDLAHLTSGDADWYDWLRETLDRAGDRLDFVTHHVYDQDGPARATEKLAGSTLFGNRPAFWDAVPPSLFEVLRVAGWTGPVWLTETGWESARVGEDRQARFYTEFLEEWLTGRPGRDWIDQVFFYEMKDPPETYTWGVLRADGSPKPAWAAYRDFVAAQSPAVPEAGRLGLLGGRFEATVTWRDPRSGQSGFGRAVPGTDESGYFWFFDAGNLELVVKAVDGRPVNGHFWFFWGALSDLEYWLEVRDTATGALARYHNPPGEICGGADTEAFPDALPAASASIPLLEPLLGSPAPLSPVPPCPVGAEDLCLLDGRLRVEVDWRIPATGASGRGTAIPSSDNSGLFWFFEPGKVELVVKALDGRPVNGRFWLFWGALSNVEYRITVVDVETGARRRYLNPAGRICGGADTEVF